MNVLSNYARVLHNSGPATIQRVNALRLSVRPIASHGPFTKLLFCSCAWSIDMPDDTLGVFRITKCFELTVYFKMNYEHERAYSEP